MAEAGKYRRVVLDLLVEYFNDDERYFLLVGDMGFGAIDKLKATHPARVINCGIMEQGMTGIAAGMSMAGLVPIVYSIVNFLVFRALEQIRNDVVLQNLAVKFIGTGAENYFRFLGPSHTCGRDDISIMKLIGMPVFDPYSKDEPFEGLLHRWITGEGPAYLRV